MYRPMHKKMSETIGVAANSATIKQFGDLTVNQQQKYAHLKGIYTDESAILSLVQLLEPRGENSWKRVNDKIDSLLHADYKSMMYHDTLYENFEIGKMYSSADIIKIVGSVRRDMALQTYLSSLKRNCENDFFGLYIVETNTTEICCEDDAPGSTKLKKVIAGYTPLFRLKPEE